MASSLRHMDSIVFYILCFIYCQNEHVWRSLKSIGTRSRNGVKNHAFPASQICHERRSNTENCQKFMRRATHTAKTKTVQNETKWYSHQYGQTLNMELPVWTLATKCSKMFNEISCSDSSIWFQKITIRQPIRSLSLLLLNLSSNQNVLKVLWSNGEIDLIIQSKRFNDHVVHN